MGPTLLLDKSAFQALSRREHVALSRHFFLTVVPVLALEVVADLSKENKKGIPARDKVRELAGKFGGSGRPMSKNYAYLCVQNLLGVEIPMTGQVIPESQRIVEGSGRGRGVLVEPAPLNLAILRWSQGEFFDFEREFAELWRAGTQSLSISSLQDQLRKRHIVLPRPGSEGEIVHVVDGLLHTQSLQEVWFEWLLRQLAIPDAARFEISKRWQERDVALLRDHAAFAHHCLRSLLALVVAVQHRYLRHRPTDLVDVQYLYYLPFCAVFCSDDRVHRLLAPQLTRDDQIVVPLGSLKQDLKRIADFFDGLSEEERARMSYALGLYPPPARDSAIWDVWLRLCRPWNGPQNRATNLSQEERARALDEVRALFASAAT